MHELVIREILHPWIYKERLLHNFLRMQWMTEFHFKTNRISGKWEMSAKWNEKLKLVPSTQSICWKFNFTVTFLMLKTHVKFSSRALRASFFFRNWEMSRNSHFNFPCYLSISGKSESLGERDRKCLILLRYYYSSLYFLCFVHGSWVVDAFSDFFNQKFYQQQLRLVKNETLLRSIE